MVTVVQPRLVLADPHNSTDMSDALCVLDAIYDTLVRRTDAGHVPCLARAWNVAEEGRVWTFHLVDGVTFHDGSPLDAAAVVASLRRMARPDMGVTLGAPGVYAQYLTGAEIEALDATTVRIALASPMSDLLDLLGYGYVAAPGSLDDPVASPVGSGPYRVAEVTADAIRLARHDAHVAGRPPFAEVVFRKVPDRAARLAMLSAGEADVAIRVPKDAVLPGATLVDHMEPTVVIYMFHVARGRLADPRIRRALNLAIDRRRIVDSVLGGGGVPLHGPFSRVHAGYVPPVAEAPDPAAARALLAEAGAEGLVIETDTPTSLPDVAEALTAEVGRQLAEVGVTLDVRRIEDREEYAHMVRRSEVRDMCVFDSSPLSTWRVLREKLDARHRGSWWLGYHNADVERLIDESARTPDTAARHALFRRAHDALVADPPWLFCFCEVHRSGIAGTHPEWRMRSDGVLDVRTLPPTLERP
jgi:peptide/nickel transport system substrate-binding protein